MIRLMPMDEYEYRNLWESIGRSRRKIIISAVERGERLADPVDAEMAVHMAARRQRSNWTLLALPVVSAVLILSIGLARDVTVAGSVLSSVLGGVTSGVFAIPAWRKWKTVLHRTIEVNRDVGKDIHQEE